MKKHLEKISKYKPSTLQGTLHLEVARSRASLASEHPLERRAFLTLCIALALLVAAYLYFVTASVLHVIARTEATSQVAAIESSIGALQEKYFALSQEISPSTGAALGLAPISRTSYVYRPGNAAVREVATNQI